MRSSIPIILALTLGTSCLAPCPEGQLRDNDGACISAVIVEPEPAVDPAPDPLTPDEIAQGDQTFTTHEAMATFCGTYRGVSGTVQISGREVTDTSALSCLESIQGNLVVDASTLRALDLPALHEVHGSITIEEARALETIGLPALTTIGASAKLAKLDQLTGLTLHIAEVDDLWVTESPRFSELVLPELTVVHEYLRVESNDVLDNVELPKLATAGGVDLADGVLERLDLSQLTTTRDGLSVVHMESLTDLDLSGLQTAGWLHMYSVGDLDRLSLPVLEEVGTFTLQVVGVSTLEAPLLHTSGLLELFQTQVQDVEFPVLVEAGQVELCENERLRSVDLPVLVEIEELDVSYEPTLQTLGLPRLERIEGDLDFNECDALTALDVPTLVSITGAFEITSTAISRISAPNLNTSLDSLSIKWNDDLIDISSIGTIHGIDDGFYVTSNDLLPQAQVDALLAEIGEGNIGGSIETRFNGP